MDQDSDNTETFAIGLPLDGPRTISALFEHAYPKIKSMWPFIPFSLDIQDLFGSFGYDPYLYLTYSHHEEFFKDVRMQKTKLDREEVWSADEFESLIIEKEEGSLTVTDIRLPKGHAQDNFPELLKQLAEYCQGNDIRENLIATHFEYPADDDGINRPFFRLVFREKR